MDRCALPKRFLRALAIAAICAASIGADARGQDAECPEPNNSYLRACPLTQPITTALSGAEDRDHYRFDVLESGAQARAELTEAAPGLRLRLLDWGGRNLAETTVQSGTARIEATLLTPGTYYLAVDASGGMPGGPYSLAIGVTYPSPPPRVVLTRDTVADDAPSSGAGEGATTLMDGRYTVQLRRGGTPAAGVAAARALSLPDGPEIGDFTLTADARFERATGSAAIQARFRYQAEAGGGSGYIVSLEPFDGRVRLAAFEEGRQIPLTDWIAHPAARGNFDTARLVVQAIGSTIAVSVNGEPLLSVEDTRYASGYLTIGAVTWSGPVSATFDNVLVTTPAR